MTVSKRTRRCRFWKFIFTFLHICCLLGPFLFFIPYGFVTTTEVASKVALSFSAVVGMIFGAISFMVDTTNRAGLHKSIMWILISGVLFCLESLKVANFIWIMAITSICDELIFVKLRQHYKAALISNREIDRRS